jgi:glycosyltransferase involved in cell wall biosynthesis
MFQFIFKIIFQYRKIIRNINPDLVINASTYPLDTYPAYFISKKTKAKLIFEAHDLWPLSPMIIGGYSKFHPFIWIMQRAENFAYKYSDKVISLFDKSYPHMKEHGLKEEKFFCIPNGYSSNEWRENNFLIPDTYKVVLNDLKLNGKFIIGYAGGHSDSNALDSVIDAANIIKEKNNIIFVLVGKGVLKDRLIKKTQELQLNNILFLDSVKKKEIPNLISFFDIAYMGGVHSVLHKYGTSYNKMTDYMLSSIPIIASIDEPDSLIERIGCGVQVEAENPQLIIEAIDNILSMSKDERISMGMKGKEYAEKNLEYGILAKRFIDIVLSDK